MKYILEEHIKGCYYLSANKKHKVCRMKTKLSRAAHNLINQIETLLIRKGYYKKEKHRIDITRIAKETGIDRSQVDKIFIRKAGNITVDRLIKLSLQFHFTIVISPRAIICSDGDHEQFVAILKALDENLHEKDSHTVIQ